jgi:hypothetical protein
LLALPPAAEVRWEPEVINPQPLLQAPFLNSKFVDVHRLAALISLLSFIPVIDPTGNYRTAVSNN